MVSEALSSLTVEYRSLGSLAAFPNNARTHSKHQIRQIAASIEKFGFTNPILIDSKNTIIAGHGRVAAAKLLGLQRVPTIRPEGLSGQEIQSLCLTAMSPLQYQKQLRLQSARSLMLNNGFDAASAAFEVGYESATQFNREYSRFFGQPPMRDIRGLLSPGAANLELVGIR